MKIKKGDRVDVDYEGRFENGEVFDSSQHGDHSHPLTFTVGSGEVIPGFDDAVVGMEEGEEKEFSIEPKDAYGEYDARLRQDVPRDALPKDEEVKEGMGLVVGMPTGEQFPVKILSVSAANVTLDLNHPLAGKKLIFKIKVSAVGDKAGKRSHHSH